MVNPAGTAVSAVDTVDACLDRIALRDHDVAAWSFLDAGSTRACARECDARPAASAVHGWTVGLKDVIDTANLPTEYGSPIWKGHRPAVDAEVARRLADAGAIMLGKTTTTEFATFEAPATRNPHDLSHTPGGSSSGSAAAVADGQVRVAIGTQTAGSVLRPASFCGVFGFKPTYARWSVGGVQPLAVSFDTLGAFARTVGDLRRLDEVLATNAEDDPPQYPVKQLRIGLLVAPWADRAEQDALRALLHVCDQLADAGVAIQEIPPSPCLGELEAAHTLTFLLEADYWLAPFMAPDPQRVSARLRQALSEAARAGVRAAQDARSVLRRVRTAAAGWLDSCDLVLLLAAPGQAPPGIAWTGDPVFNRLASTLGCPAISVPAGRGDAGLPLGVQFLAGPDRDRFLLRTVRDLLDLCDIGKVPELPT